MRVTTYRRGGFMYAECRCGWSLQSHGTDESSRGATEAAAASHETTHMIHDRTMALVNEVLAAPDRQVSA